MHLPEIAQIVAGTVPADLQTAVGGDYVSLAKFKYCDVIFFKAVGTAGDDPDLTLRQASDVAGTGVKDLDVIDTYYLKQAALLSTEGQFTKVAQTADALISFDATSAEEQLMCVFTVAADTLDIANGFDCIVVNIADVGANAQIGAVLYILREPRYAEEPIASAIVD